jgi:hypothetical protein
MFDMTAIVLVLSAISTMIAAVTYGVARLDRMVIGIMALRKSPPEKVHKVVQALAEMQVNTSVEQK